MNGGEPILESWFRTESTAPPRGDEAISSNPSTTHLRRKQPQTTINVT